MTFSFNWNFVYNIVTISVPDPDPNPDPDPLDPHVFGPPGSGSISQRCGSGTALDPDPSIKQK
jgi:hypothetical protein